MEKVSIPCHVCVYLNIPNVRLLGLFCRFAPRKNTGFHKLFLEGLICCSHSLNEMAASRDAAEMMVSMAALILQDENMDITPENIQKLIDAAGGKVEPYLPKLYCQAIEGLDINSMMTAVGSAPAAGAAPAAAGAAAPAAEEKKEEKKEEPEEEEDDDMGFGLFD
eukprot:Protomagalhaensia_wolfi_Nauph_80__5648@NODE_654_length_2160_cov_717_694955_g489_i0_p2_GENE_NODE_654_length_2160_cov_717_694955_g489_i0NODE_654_length_2160_cov_717_694955_g489_i0_p2_ORF_typecomplete_len165_score48_85Ribosomal_60s/PF00428_19/6e27LPD38/PF18857_1/0_051DUF3824/PF12868_7/0_093Shadoo/PF14999_6/0_21Sporozoite_P67/PF05642_11/3_8_NODE_654_length_2160_cov_717_694955_g489_i09731467